ncbi:FkbM family methyltransferase [Phormidium tenue FACHB-886]|nr:FkbM family methyltransferase [Phormidium tenue FACHB-886]
MLNLRHKIQTVANTFGYKISKVHPAREFPLIDVLSLVMLDQMRHNPHPFFVQIGAHDGQSSDPIYQLVKHYHWQGLLVEPQPNAFQILMKTYGDEPQLQFENAAIASADGTATLYRVRETEVDLPHWYYQIASLSRDKVVDVLERWKTLEKDPRVPADIADWIEELPIPALSVRTLLSKHQVERIDLLVIDTMGFDFEILKMFPFELIKPAVIHFEHNHLSSNDQAACLELLIAQGYSLAKVAVDTIAYLNAPTRHWGMTNW